MRMMGTSDNNKCVACIAIRKYELANNVDKGVMAGMMIGVGIEGTGLTPTFCDMHYKLIEQIGEEFTNGEVSTLRSRQH